MSSVEARVTAEWGSQYDLRGETSPLNAQKIRRALSASLPPPAPLIRADQQSEIASSMSETPPEVDPEGDPPPPLLQRSSPLTEEELLTVEATEATNANVSGQYDETSRHVGWIYGAPCYVDNEYQQQLMSGDSTVEESVEGKKTKKPKKDE